MLTSTVWWTQKRKEQTGSDELPAQAMHRFDLLTQVCSGPSFGHSNRPSAGPSSPVFGPSTPAELDGRGDRSAQYTDPTGTKNDARTSQGSPVRHGTHSTIVCPARHGLVARADLSPARNQDGLMLDTENVSLACLWCGFHSA